MAEVERSEKKKAHHMHGFFSFADWIDVLLMLLGTVGSVGDGCSTGFILIFASSVMNSLGGHAHGDQKQNNMKFMHEVEKVGLLSC